MFCLTVDDHPGCLAACSQQIIFQDIQRTVKWPNVERPQLLNFIMRRVDRGKSQIFKSDLLEDTFKVDKLVGNSYIS